ncbi:MAG: sugar phosphate isomerase/epimerase [Clostridia bacterium]|nr:sugar phosphate isomerase/epimerase [Clostridia bacterium]
MFKLGLSSCGKPLCEELFKNYKKAGIEAMEISLGVDEYATLDLTALRHMADGQGVELWSLHLPFMPFDKIDISRPELAEETVEYLSGLIRRGAEAGIDKFIIHPSGEPIKPEERAERMATAKSSLAKLAEVARECGAVIAVEDLPRTCLGNTAAEIAELISVHPDLRVCFDTNHLLTEDAADFVRALGDKIITTHVSDYDFLNERHWLPGEGKLDWQSIVNALCEVNYSGPWLYELGFACPKTLIRDRELTCEDFARNAAEIFENKQISIFSKPKENI